jgi:accessory gene regulator B
VIIIEVLANKIADGIALQLSLEEEKRSVIAYGLIGILQVITLLLVITIIGLVTGSLYESLIIFVSVAFLRKSTGGAHSKTMVGCNTVSVLSIALLAITSRYLLSTPIDSYVNIGITTVVFFLGYVIFYLRVPVDSINKPIVTMEKIKRLRKESFSKLFLFFILTVTAILLADTHERFYSIASSIRVAMIWQAMTLTETGTLLLSRLDSIVNRMLSTLNIL